MLTTIAFIAITAVVDGDAVSTKFIASGATAKVGGYRPLRAEMNGTAESVKTAPEGLVAPKYGEIKIGDKSWGFILDEPEGHDAKLFIDTNGDGDYTNDAATTWTARKNGELTMYQGTGQVNFGDGKMGSLGLYRFDPSDPQRAQLKNTLMFYTDYGYEITLKLDGKEFTSFVAGNIDSASSLWVDRDGNHRTSYRYEMVYAGKPFNFTGTTYVLNVAEGGPKLEKATETLPVLPLPPDLAIGKKALPFKMAALDGDEIDFPKTYAGKIVMLDFWATWCGPCIAELPNVKKAYEDWHDQGFEVLGISFDDKDMAEKLKTFTEEKGMAWRHIYEGKLWETKLGEMYDVSGIPFVLLVDGDSGEILGTSRELRGEGLTDFIGKTLTKKKDDSK